MYENVAKAYFFFLNLEAYQTPIPKPTKAPAIVVKINSVGVIYILHFLP